MADSLRRLLSRRFTVWQKLTALAPMLLLVVAAPGQELLRCSMDGILRTACCCPAASPPKDDGATAVLKTPRCCDRVAAAAVHPAAETARTIHDQPASPTFEAWVTPLAFSITDRGRRSSPQQSHGPPRDGPSVLLLKSAFLI